MSLLHLQHNLTLNFALHHLVLAANAGDTISLVLGGAVLRIVGRHEFWARLAINPVRSVVESRSGDGVLEVEVALGDVRLSDRSKK